MNQETKQTFNTNRNFKSDLFAALFSEKPERLVELFNFVMQTDYPADTEVELVTLEDALFTNFRDDIAFVMNHCMLLITEHQSTFNENMPMRDLQYLSKEYMRMISHRSILQRKLVKIPTPQLIVLYNGKEKRPAREILKLSDAYMVPTDDPCLEVKVTVINLNHPDNEPYIKRARTLSDYHTFVRYVTALLAETKNLDSAISAAIRYCVANDILKEFLLSHEAEVADMMKFSWTLEDLLEVNSDEAREEGWEKGLVEGLVKGREEATRQFSQLTKLLLEQNRLDDLTRAAEDETVRDALCLELGILSENHMP